MSLSIEKVQAEGLDLYETFKKIQAAYDKKDKTSVKALLDHVSTRKDDMLAACNQQSTETAYKAAEAWFELEMACGEILLENEDFPVNLQTTYDEVRYALPQVAAAKLVDEGMDVDLAMAVIAISPDESSQSIYSQAELELRSALAAWGIRQQTPTAAAIPNQPLKHSSFRLVA